MKTISYLFLVTMLLLVTVSGQTASDFQQYVKNKTIVGMTGDTDFPIIALHENGSMIGLQTNTTSGSPVAILFYEKLTLEPVIMEFGEDNKPKRIYKEGYTFVLNQKGDTSYQIGLMRPDGTTDIVNHLAMSLPKLVIGETGLQIEMPKGPMIGAEVHLMEIDILASSLNALKYASTALSLFSCGAALIPPVGVSLILPCASAVLDIYSNYINDEAKGAVASSEVLNSIGNYQFFQDADNAKGLAELKKLSGKANIAGILVYGMQKALETVKSRIDEKKIEEFNKLLQGEYQSFIVDPPAYQKLNVVLDTVTAKGIFAMAHESENKIEKLKEDKKKLSKTANANNFKKVQADIDKIDEKIKQLKADYEKRIKEEIKKSPKIEYPFIKTDGESHYRIFSVVLTDFRYDYQPLFLLDVHFSKSKKTVRNPYTSDIGYTQLRTIIAEHRGPGITREQGKFGLSVSKNTKSPIQYGVGLERIENTKSFNFFDSWFGVLVE